MKKHWSYYLTPCILTALGCLVLAIWLFTLPPGPHGFTILFSSLLIVGSLLLLAADLLIKSFIKESLHEVWIIEGIGLIILFIFIL